MTVKPIPEGYHTITPYLVVSDVATLIDFLTQAFDAEETERFASPDGAIMHAAMRIGDSVVMMGQATDEWPSMPASLYLYVEDTDALYERALQAGATSLMAPEDQFWGDRNASVRDPVGNHWTIATRQEDVPPDELSQRMAAMFEQGPQ